MILVSVIIVLAGIIGGFAFPVFCILYLNCTILGYSDFNRHRTCCQHFIRLCYANQLKFRSIGACLIKLDGKISGRIIVC